MSLQRHVLFLGLGMSDVDSEKLHLVHVCFLISVLC